MSEITKSKMILEFSLHFATCGRKRKYKSFDTFSIAENEVAGLMSFWPKLNIIF